MDNLTKEQRSKAMKAIRSNDTTAEITLRRQLWWLGYRYRKNYKKLKGTPDIVFIKQKVVIFVDGEFWHGYNWATVKSNIKTNSEYWIKKIENNMKRDFVVNEILQKDDWVVLRFWTRYVKKNTNECVNLIIKELERNYD